MGRTEGLDVEREKFLVLDEAVYLDAITRDTGDTSDQEVAVFLFSRYAGGLKAMAA